MLVPAIGWWLGGVIGIDTVVYAIGIGPVVHWMLDMEKKIGLVG